MTPPPMHRVRCIGWTCDDTPTEAKLHGRQCPLHASPRVKFPRLSLDASHDRGGGRTSRGGAPAAAREIYRPESGIAPSEHQYNSKSPCIRQGRDFEILGETGRLAAPKNYFTTSQWPVLELPIRFIKDLRVNALIWYLTPDAESPSIRPICSAEI